MSFVLNPLRWVAWPLIRAWVRQQFPGVTSVSTAELAHWLAHDSSLRLVDVRQAEEYAVSHLPGAEPLPTVEAIQQADIATDTTIVLYCSIGYRSARLAQQLQAVGYHHVFNLEGSIFAWHNQGRPLVANHEPTQAIHPYDSTWGLLLKPRPSERH
ncbi:MAG: rhodanese-like domain-containing protein [Leptolyngbyaceae cyanobacterium]